MAEPIEPCAKCAKPSVFALPPGLGKPRTPLCAACLSIAVQAVVTKLEEKHRPKHPSVTLWEHNLWDIGNQAIGAMAAAILAGVVPRDATDKRFISFLDQFFWDVYHLKSRQNWSPRDNAFAARHMRERVLFYVDAIERAVAYFADHQEGEDATA